MSLDKAEFASASFLLSYLIVASSPPSGNREEGKETAVFCLKRPEGEKVREKVGGGVCVLFCHRFIRTSLCASRWLKHSCGWILTLEGNFADYVCPAVRGHRYQIAGIEKASHTINSTESTRCAVSTEPLPSLQAAPAYQNSCIFSMQ